MTLLKNTCWNIFGTAISALAMIPATAYVARQLDVESFGLLTLILSFVGYAAVLDAGIARAVIREVAHYRFNAPELAKIIGTAFWLVLVCAFLSVGLLIGLTSDAVRWLSVSVALQSAADQAFTIGAFTVVPLLLTALWNAPLEGLGKFKALNVVRGIGYSLMFSTVALSVYIHASLVSAVLGLLAGRTLMVLLALFVGRSVLGYVPLVFDMGVLKRLYGFGGWLTLSNMVSSTMDYLDRFVLSSVAGAQEVAFYSAPADLVAKLSALPHALSRALFPHLSAKSADKTLSTSDLGPSIKIQFLLGVGVFLVALLFGNEVMRLWLGSKYAEISGTLIKFLAFGFLCNSCNLVPYTALQAAGQSKLTAAVYLVELVPYVVALVVLVNLMGVYGAAVAWCMKCGFEMVAFFWLYKKHVVIVD